MELRVASHPINAAGRCRGRARIYSKTMKEYIGVTLLILAAAVGAEAAPGLSNSGKLQTIIRMALMHACMHVFLSPDEFISHLRARFLTR